ncbi:hypothetical protein FCL40_04290 [Ferrimonas sediminicola]|uniref:Uncharacterized protein n=1 Tax=Ferrimonas sediminicola TaxID=2569538 RepID=A0A4U1BJW7_9GAMM|nr:hypothetical protein [Ferrimonas sediminicola]TKB50380.1 hypothetical protein FCL40_04290 [Ferrimonas sediminicola]
MVRKAFKLGGVLLVVAGLSGCSEDNQQRVEDALVQAGQAVEMLGSSAAELAQVAWLEGQSLWHSGEALARDKQQAFNQWRRPVSPISRYGVVEPEVTARVTAAPGEDPSQARSNREESHHP